jgi:hypothetical protein
MTVDTNVAHIMMLCWEEKVVVLVLQSAVQSNQGLPTGNA